MHLKKGDLCLYPKLIKNPKYRSNKKNGGIIPDCPDERVKMVPIGCKNCIECRQQKARDWRVRLLEEYRNNKNAIFVTLTFSNESILYLKRKVEKDSLKPEGYEMDNAIASKAVRYFLENWRKQNNGKSVKHWLITELGHEGTENIHLHGIIWSKDKDAIKKAWKRGFIYFGYSFSEKGINYFTKYVNKVDSDHKYYIPKIYCSAGIGAGYEKRHDSKRNEFKPEGGTDELYINRQGYKMALPLYFRNKLYTEEEREKLWIEKLDKQTRYVLGTEVDISTEQGIEYYYRLLEEVRRKNKRLGYGSDEINWDKAVYENQRRALLLKKRIDDLLYDEFDPDTGELFE